MLMAIICIISACSHKLHLTKKCEQENPSISEIVSESIESLFNISKYKPEMTSGYFLQINFPAINFNFSELSFANLSDFTVNRNELNKAYRFSKITNNVFICDSMGCNTVFALEDIIEKINMDIILLNNPTYNEEFYPSFPVH